MLKPEQAEERKPDAVWSGLPLYRCQYCQRFERVNNLEAVLEHEHTVHAPKRAPSSLLDAAGRPIEIERSER